MTTKRGRTPIRRPNYRQAGVDMLRMAREAPESVPRGTRAVLYMRVSTRQQDVASQERRLHEEAARLGLAIVHKYVDHGISGAKGRDARPALDAMLLDAQTGRYDIVLVYKLDRLGRSLRDLLMVLSLLQDNRRHLVVVDLGLDTSTPIGRMFFQVAGIFAEYERGVIGERVVAGIAATRAKGTALGRKRSLSADEAAAAYDFHHDPMKKMTMRALATKFGVSANTICQAIKREQTRRRLAPAAAAA